MENKLIAQSLLLISPGYSSTDVILFPTRAKMQTWFNEVTKLLISSQSPTTNKLSSALCGRHSFTLSFKLQQLCLVPGYMMRQCRSHPSHLSLYRRNRRYPWLPALSLYKCLFALCVLPGSTFKRYYFTAVISLQKKKKKRIKGKSYKLTGSQTKKQLKLYFS